MYDTTIGRWLEEDPIGFEAGDANLYRYVLNGPTNAADPTGLVEEAENITGNQYGDWKISQKNKFDLLKKPYESQVAIRFQPNKDIVCSDQIAFVQIVRITDQGSPLVKDGTPVEGKYLPDKAVLRQTKAGWHLDALADQKYGWFAYGNDGKPVSKDNLGSYVIPGSAPKPYQVAELSDSPGDPNGISFLRWEFETFAVAISGKDAGKIYGGIYWGFDVGDKHEMTSLARHFLNGPTTEFQQSVTLWDRQALGPEKNRTTPDQALLTPIYFPPPSNAKMPGLWWRYHGFETESEA